MDKARIGFVGVGSMGQSAHLKNYAVLDGCEVAAIAELRPNLRQAVAERYGVATTYGSAAEMLSAEKLDGIVASQPFSRHGVLLPELLRAGAPVFIEKPLASSLAVGERVVAAEADSPGWLMVGYNKRSDPATMYAKAEIDRLKASGELGELRYVRITMPPGDWIAGGFDDQVRLDWGRQDLETDPPDPDMDAATFKRYTEFVNYYIHQVNLMRHLLGEPYRVTHADASGVLLVAQSESGVCGSIEMAPYHTTLDWQESALACFRKGYVRLDLPAPVAQARPGRVEILRDPGDGAAPQTVRPQLPWVSSMRQQAANFLRAIRGEIAPPCGAAEALEDLKVAREYSGLLTSVSRRER
jgi:predicted dehydrogenase